MNNEKKIPCTKCSKEVVVGKDAVEVICAECVTSRSPAPKLKYKNGVKTKSTRVRVSSQSKVDLILPLLKEKKSMEQIVKVVKEKMPDWEVSDYSICWFIRKVKRENREVSK